MIFKLALNSALFCLFILVMFFIYMTDDVIGAHYLHKNEKITAYSYLLNNIKDIGLSPENQLFTDGLAIGSAFALASSMFCIFIANGRVTVLLLSGYFLASAILLTLLLGVPITVISPEIYQLYGIDVPLLVVISKILLMWFALLIFRLRAHSTKVYWIIKSFCWVLLIYLPVCYILPIKTSFFLSVYIELFICGLLIILGIYLIQKSRRLSVLFVLFVFIQFIFALLNTVALFGFDIDIYQQHRYLYATSFWLSGCLTVFMLSRGYFYQIQDKQKAEKKALASLEKSKKAQAELFTLQEENQEKLESRVQERTLELNIALQELESANEELAEKNTLDELTGLYNRRYYDQKIIAEFRRSRRNLTPLSLVVVDIDHFKNVNDSYGHIAGDQCLKWIAGKIKQALGRVTDIGCRYGGEEFCLILPETDTKGAMSLAEILRDSIQSEIFVYDKTDIPMTISCGVSTYWQQPEITPENIFSAADQALYSAKKNGRNQVQKKILSSTIKSN